MKKFLSIIIGTIAFLIIFTNYSFGAKSTGLDIDIIAKQNSNMSEEALNSLKENFNYKGDVVGKNMKLDTTITFMGDSRLNDGTYHIQIGSASDGVIGDIPSISKENLEKLGYNFDNPENLYGYEKSGNKVKWKVVLIADFKDEDIKSQEGSSSLSDLHIHIKEAYGGTEEDYNYGLNEVNPEAEEERFGAEEHYDEVQESVENKFEFFANFAKNPAGTIFTALFDGVLRVVDVIQMIANFFETLPLKTSSDLAVVYSFDYLQADGNESSSSNTDEGAGHRNMYTEVQAGYTENNKSSWQTEDPVNIDIDNTNNAQTTNVEVKEYGFSNKTLIPVIPVDVYTIAKGRIGIFDANFLKVDTNIHPNENSLWFTLRKIATLTIRGLIYITAGILGTSLMFNAFNILKGKIIEKKTPGEERDYMYGLITFAKSLLLLIGTVVIIALAIYINKLFISYSNIDTGTVELPIRVNVKEANYSFSTTQTGVVRYFAQIKNPDLIGEKIMYVFIYLILAVINLVMAILFFLRMVIMMVGSAYGIIIVAARTLGRENLLPMDYQHWVISFFSVSLMQTILILANSIANSI